MPFVKGNTPPTNADLYFTPRPEPLLQTISPLQGPPNAADPLPLTTSSADTPFLPTHPRLLQSQDALAQRAPSYSKVDLLYHVDRITRVYRLAIPPVVSTEVITHHCTWRETPRILKMLRDYLSFLVHLWLDKVVENFHTPLPTVPSLTNAASSTLWFASANSIPSSTFFHVYSRFCASLANLKGRLQRFDVSY